MHVQYRAVLRCSNTSFLVEESCYEEVLKIAKDACDKVLVDSPKKEGDHIGPLFDKIQFERVQTLINAGIDEGATLLCGGPGKPEGLKIAGSSNLLSLRTLQMI